MQHLVKHLHRHKIRHNSSDKMWNISSKRAFLSFFFLSNLGNISNNTFECVYGRWLVTGAEIIIILVPLMSTSVCAWHNLLVFSGSPTKHVGRHWVRWMIWMGNSRWLFDESIMRLMNDCKDSRQSGISGIWFD